MCSATLTGNTRTATQTGDTCTVGYFDERSINRATLMGEMYIALHWTLKYLQLEVKQGKVSFPTSVAVPSAIKALSLPDIQG